MNKRDKRDNKGDLSKVYTESNKIDISKQNLINHAVEVTQHLGLVHYHARVFATATRWDWYEDFVGAGHIGLMQASENFNSNLNPDFGKFASPRIKGAMQDFVRKQDHLKRYQRDKVNAGKMIDRGFVQSWEGLIEQKGDRVQIIQDGSLDPLVQVLNRMEHAQVRAALKQLPERQANILIKYYFQNMTYAAIGKEIGRTYFAVYQMAERGLKRLRVLMEDTPTK